MADGGYRPIRDHAIIGDGRTAALVTTDGTVDWLCLPDFDAPSVFGSILDSQHGGSFTLAPAVPFQSHQHYTPDTNILETRFTTSTGAVRVVDALTLPNDRLCGQRELVRIVECLEGEVPLAWAIEPRFGYGARSGTPADAGPAAVWRDDVDALAARSWELGAPTWHGGATWAATCRMHAGQRGVIAISWATGEPLVFPTRAGVEERLLGTEQFWKHWAGERPYAGPFREAVIRSALALKLMIYAPSGASVAAPTASLPEEIGGVRNWDYRFCWIRDSAFLIDALLRLGCREEARALFWWFMQATTLTAPRLQVLYRLDGSDDAAERTLPLDGYCGSRPVRIGNAAVDQHQLDLYGDLFETIWLYAKGEHELDRDTGVRVADMADYICEIWRHPDAGIWEVRGDARHFTHSKVMCWVALDRAIRLADEGDVPSRRVDRWRAEAAAIVSFVDEQCWSDEKRSYVQHAGGESVDASLLMLSLMGFGGNASPRVMGTVDAVCRELRRGPFVFRYLNEDGLPGSEGCFLNCSFWLVGALARVGRLDEANALMTDLLARGNHVGLFAEEIDPATGAFLGNFPQALVHLSLIDAALAIGEAEQTSQGPKKGKASA
ncbi:MAG: glycoside hydrolase family 15 protein [Acidobacteria bacterium]|nr:glycoside hydrolase family 15 protein [Acidobacteriota bacterium]